MAEEEEKSPKVIMMPTVREQLDDDPELAGVMKDIEAKLVEAMAGVKSGKWGDFEEACAALGLEARKTDADETYEEADWKAMFVALLTSRITTDNPEDPKWLKALEGTAAEGWEQSEDGAVPPDALVEAFITYFMEEKAKLN